MTRLAAAFCALVIALGVIAWMAPPPRQSDRNIYQQMAAEIIVPGCDLLHCFRVLVPWTLGRLPGPSLFKWKAYAVVANAAAALAVLLLCLEWGLPRRAARLAAAASAVGFGSMYTLYDPFTSDPLMFLAGPLVLWLCLIGRSAPAGVLAGVFVTAKEFAIVPLYMHAVTQWFEGRRAPAIRAAVLAVAGLAVWIALQVWLRTAYGYFYGPTPSAQPLQGGYLWFWYTQTPGSIAVAAMVAELGALWLLAAAGWRFAPPPLRHAVFASLPPAAVLVYLQQPDRALWNFHFLFTPLAALLLVRVPPLLAAATLVSFALGNLRVAAQLPFMPPSRALLALSFGLGLACWAWSWRHPMESARPAA